MKKQRYSGLIVKYNNKILLCKRNAQGSYPGMWSIPGGKVEGGESTLEACKREFMEETNVDISDQELEFVGVIPRYTRDGKKVKGLMYVYLLEVDQPIEPDFVNAVDGDEHTDFAYFSLKQIRPEDSGTFLYELAKIILK
jgi:8-oxo-dGTP pyrophosphatase MutT (NUDIX family)